jgi:hypothetical protein
MKQYQSQSLHLIMHTFPRLCNTKHFLSYASSTYKKVFLLRKTREGIIKQESTKKHMKQTLQVSLCNSPANGHHNKSIRENRINK